MYQGTTSPVISKEILDLLAKIVSSAQSGNSAGVAAGSGTGADYSQWGNRMTGGGDSVMAQNYASPSSSGMGGQGNGLGNNEQVMQYIKKLLSQMNNSNFYNPYMKGPDWGSGISGIIDQLGAK
jgi:hypothetical protein